MNDFQSLCHLISLVHLKSLSMIVAKKKRSRKSTQVSASRRVSQKLRKGIEGSWVVCLSLNLLVQVGGGIWFDWPSLMPVLLPVVGMEGRS